jgi:hypothetical protein
MMVLYSNPLQYRTNDGKTFPILEEAEHHEKYLEFDAAFVKQFGIAVYDMNKQIISHKDITEFLWNLR